MLRTFELMPASEIFAIVRERREAVFRARRSTLGLEHVESKLADIDLYQSFGVPPSVILTPRTIANAFSYRNNDSSSVWVRFFSICYINQGQFSFKKLDEETFEVRVSFEEMARPG